MTKLSSNKPSAPKYNVRIHSIHMEGALRATASVSIYGDFAVRKIKVMEGANGLFISMPSYKTNSGEYKDICFPCTKEARAEFNDAVIAAYQQALTQVPAQQSPDRSQQTSQPPTMTGP